MPQKKKIFGISLRVELIEKYNEKRDTISQEWTNFLQKLAITPILIPNTLDDVKSYISDVGIDGIILSGGDNIGKFPERDETEKQIQVEKDRAISEIRQEVVSLTISVAEKVVKKNLSKEDNQGLIEDSLKNLEGYDA